MLSALMFTDNVNKPGINSIINHRGTEDAGSVHITV